MYNMQAIDQELRYPTLHPWELKNGTKTTIAQALQPFLELSIEAIQSKSYRELERMIKDLLSFLKQREAEKLQEWQEVIQFQIQQTIDALIQLGYHASIDQSHLLMVRDAKNGLTISGREVNWSDERLSVLEISMNEDHFETMNLDLSLETDDTEALRRSLHEKQKRIQDQINEQFRACEQLLDALAFIVEQTRVFAANQGMDWKKR